MIFERYNRHQKLSAQMGKSTGMLLLYIKVTLTVVIIILKQDPTSNSGFQNIIKLLLSVRSNKLLVEFNENAYTFNYEFNRKHKISYYGIKDHFWRLY